MTKLVAVSRAVAALVRRRAIAGYRWIAEPRHERIIWGLIYTTITASGIGAIATVPMVIENLVGYWGTVGLAGLTATGGLAGLVSVLPDIRPIERIGCSLNALAYALYAVVLWGIGASPLAVGYTVALSLVMLLRLVQLRGPKPARPLQS
jgi:hypothetical protein